MNTNVKTFELESLKKLNGNQYKWFSDPYYIKADTNGYESLSEVLCSILISFIKDIDFVKYEFCKIKDIETGELMNGCYCKSYLNADETSYGIYSYLIKKVDCKMKDKSNEKLYEEILNLGIPNTYDYLSKMIYIDALILNEDRHFNNIQVIENNDTGKLKFSPIFDNGMALLSDVTYYPMIEKYKSFINTVKCRPFKTNFKEQISMFNREPLKIDIDGFIKYMKEFEIPYEYNKTERAVKILEYQLNKYEGALWERC